MGRKCVQRQARFLVTNNPLVEEKAGQSSTLAGGDGKAIPQNSCRGRGRRGRLGALSLVIAGGWDALLNGSCSRRPLGT